MSTRDPETNRATRPEAASIWPSDWVMPSYDGGGIANIGPSILRHFGVPDLEDVPALPGLSAKLLPPALLEGVRTIVLLVIDALGYDQLTERLGDGSCPRLSARLANQSVILSSLTSVFPSTTAAALTTLHTASAPAQHGMLGFSLFLPEAGEVANMLEFKPMSGHGSLGITPQGFLPLPTLYHRLAAAGVASHGIIPADLVRSPLSRMFTGGSAVRPCVTSTDMCVAIRHLVEASKEPTFIFAYWPHVDTIAHYYGPQSAEHGAEVAALDSIIDRELWSKLNRPDTLTVIIADHGQMTTNERHTAFLHQHPVLLKPLSCPPAGERRVPYLHVPEQHVERVRRYIAMVMDGAATIISGDDAFARGLFGLAPAWAHARGRVGDLIMLANGDWQLPYLYLPEEREHPWQHLSIGAHGGLTSAEMRVPLLVMRGG